MKKTPKEIADRAKIPAECDSLLKNAIENGWDEIAVEVRKRSIYLRAKLEDPATSIEEQCWQAVCAYEDVLTQKNGKKTYARRIRNSAKNKGIVLAIAGSVSRRIDTSGFLLLNKLGLLEYSFEAVVVKFEDEFSNEVIENAKKRLLETKDLPDE